VDKISGGESRKAGGELQSSSDSFTRSVKNILGTIACIALVGCGPPPPVPKEMHVKQVRQAIARAGGETNILTESRTLFSRFEEMKGSGPFHSPEEKCFEGLSGITNLGDVFWYSSNEPERIQIRIHNSHFDTYFIDLLNPDSPEPAGFEKIAGNVGFIESKPVR